jgi:hypothetical protein
MLTPESPELLTVPSRLKSHLAEAVVTLHFHDVSNFQGNYQPTGPTIAKATEGTDFTDAFFAQNRQRTLAGGWPFLGYHFLHHGSIQAQVTHAISVVGRDQPLMLDVETAGDGSWPTLAEVEQFMDLYAQQSGGGRVTLVYLPRWFWSGNLGSPGLAGIASRGAGLISSQFTTYSDTGPGWNPYGGMTPIIWQYTSTPIDTDAFKGTQDQLANVFAGGDAMTDPFTTAEQGALDDMEWRMDAIWSDVPKLRGGRYINDPALNTNGLHAHLAAIDQTLADIKAAVEALQLGTVGLTQAQVDARIAGSTITPPAQ